MTTPYCISCRQPIEGRVLVHRGANTCETCYVREVGTLPEALAAAQVEQNERRVARDAVVRSRREHRAAALAALRETAQSQGWSADDILVTTGFEIPGHRIVDIVDVTGAECVLGMNFLADLISRAHDIIGGVDRQTTAAFAQARVQCLQSLRTQAADLGASGVIAVNFTYGELSSQGKAGVFLGVLGTAVVLEPLPSAAPPETTTPAAT